MHKTPSVILRRKLWSMISSREINGRTLVSLINHQKTYKTHFTSRIVNAFRNGGNTHLKTDNNIYKNEIVPLFVKNLHEKIAYRKFIINICTNENSTCRIITPSKTTGKK